jgi:hypothetical protein
MKTRLVPLALIAVLVLAFGAIVAACDGDDALTLEEFFQRLEQVADEFEADSAPLEEELGQLTEESSPDEALDIIRRQADLIEDFVDELDDLSPPDEAADLMDEVVSAGRDVVQALRDGIDDAEGAESIEEAFANFETWEVSTRFDQTCLDVEQLAADNGITIDLDCGEDE